MFCTALIIRIKLVYLIAKIPKLHHHALIAKFEMRFDLYMSMAHEHVGNKVRGDLVLRFLCTQHSKDAVLPSLFEMIPCVKTKLSWNSFTM